MDEWAKIKPDHVALLWASERGEEIRFTYKDLKEQSDKAAAYFQSLGIGHSVFFIGPPLLNKYTLNYTKKIENSLRIVLK